jgi:hypothetical protein
VSVMPKESVPALLWRQWRDPAAWSTTSDVFAILIAVSLPWSTTLVAIFATALLVSMGPFLDARGFLQSLKRPICTLPVALFALAAVGTLWSNVPWGVRLYAVGLSAKLLMLPALLYHFERSARGLQVLIAFLVSCVLLMVMSWIVAFDPRLALKSGAEYGVPVAWATSPKLRWTAETFVRDYQLYKEQNIPTSAGLRLEFYGKSLRFISEEPLFGHGTGSIRGLFEEAAVDQRGAAAEVISNPHNQTLNVAIQWGAIGIVVLYAMWLVHLMLFRGDDLATWIGLMVVVQNIFTSLFNSHLFDFNEGWIYVLGVGIAGGMVLSNSHEAATRNPARP